LASGRRAKGEKKSLRLWRKDKSGLPGRRIVTSWAPENNLEKRGCTGEDLKSKPKII